MYLHIRFYLEDLSATYSGNGRESQSLMLYCHCFMVFNSYSMVYVSIYVNTGNSEGMTGLSSSDTLWNNSGAFLGRTEQSLPWDCCSYIGDTAAKVLGSDEQVREFCMVFETASIQPCVAKHCFFDCFFLSRACISKAINVFLKTALEGLRVTKQQR